MEELKFELVIVYLRKKENLTQEQLAEKANMDVKYLGRLEHGYSSPTLNMTNDILNALGINTKKIMLLILLLDKYDRNSRQISYK